MRPLELTTKQVKIDDVTAARPSSVDNDIGKEKPASDVIDDSKPTDDDATVDAKATIDVIEGAKTTNDVLRGDEKTSTDDVTRKMIANHDNIMANRLDNLTVQMIPSVTVIVESSILFSF